MLAAKMKQVRKMAALTVAVLVAAGVSGCGRNTPMQALPASTEQGLWDPGTSGYHTATGTVAGRILDEKTQMGVPEVIVEVMNVSPRVTARTDASGNFVLSNVPQGNQIISVNRADYVYMATQGSIIANVLPNTTVTLPQILLTPAIASASNAFLTSIGGLVEPYGLAIDNNKGFLYAVDRIGSPLLSILDRRCEVKKFNLSGGFVKRFGGGLLNVERGNENAGKFFDLFGNLNWSYGVDVDAGGNVYVAETNKDRVVKFSAEGEYVTKISEGISNNFDVAVLNNGQIGVSSGGNSKVLVFDSNLSANATDFQGTAGLPNANGGFRGLAVDNANFVYLLDNSGGTGMAVKKYDTRGSRPVLQFGTNAGSGPGQFRGATDLAIDNRNGDIYVVDSGNNRVQRFDRDGRFISQFGGAGRGAGQLDRPFGIAIDRDGYIYIADTGNKRIQKFAPGRLFNQPYVNPGVSYPTK